MGRAYWLFTFACLGAAIFFYSTPYKIFSLLFLLLFVGCCYGAGKLG